VLCGFYILHRNGIPAATVTGAPVLAYHIGNDWPGVALCAGLYLVCSTEIR
jgi:hypothetical protein